MAGAMAPDLIYFVMLTTEWRYLSHTWLGLFLFCLPAGVIFSFVFHNWFKKPFITHLPSPLDKSLAGLAKSKWTIQGSRDWFVLVVSVLIGALSHFGWDSITHPDGAIVQAYPILNESITLFGTSRKICRIIQHLSSLSGGLVLLYYLLFDKNIVSRQVVAVQRNKAEKLKYWFGCMGFTVMLTFVAISFYNYIFSWKIFAGYYLFLGFITAVLSVWAGLFWWAVLWGFRHKEAKH